MRTVKEYLERERMPESMEHLIESNTIAGQSALPVIVDMELINSLRGMDKVEAKRKYDKWRATQRKKDKHKAQYTALKFRCAVDEEFRERVIKYRRDHYQREKDKKMAEKVAEEYYNAQS